MFAILWFHDESHEVSIQLRRWGVREGGEKKKEKKQTNKRNNYLTNERENEK